MCLQSAKYAHFSTARLREILISISQAPFIPFFPMPFSHAFPMVYFSYCGESTPISAFQAEG